MLDDALDALDRQEDKREQLLEAALGNRRAAEEAAQAAAAPLDPSLANIQRLLGVLTSSLSGEPSDEDLVRLQGAMREAVEHLRADATSAEEVDQLHRCDDMIEKLSNAPPVGTSEDAAAAENAPPPSKEELDQLKTLMEELAKGGGGPDATKLQELMAAFAANGAAAPAAASSATSAPGGAPAEEEGMPAAFQALLNPELIAKPLARLKDVYPIWLEKHRAKLSAADVKRYEAQIVKMTAIVALLQGGALVPEGEGEVDQERLNTFTGLIDELQQLGAPAASLDEILDDLGIAATASA